MELVSTAAELTDRGGREVNEDAIGSHVTPQAACWVVCDGLGGHHGGEVASRLAADAIVAAFAREPECSETLLQACLAAGEAAINETQRNDPTLEMMRTTAVVLMTDYRSVAWAHLGDSRLYHFRGGHLVSQTRDHSVPGVFAASGQISYDEIRHHVDRSRLLRSLGERTELKPGIEAPMPLAPGDSFLMCTDGFWEYVVEHEMESDLAAAPDPAEWLAAMRVRLLSRITGDNDNFTAIAVHFEGAGAIASPSPDANLLPAPATVPTYAVRKTGPLADGAHQSPTARHAFVRPLVLMIGVVLVLTTLVVAWQQRDSLAGLVKTIRSWMQGTAPETVNGPASVPTVPAKDTTARERLPSTSKTPGAQGSTPTPAAGADKPANSTEQLQPISGDDPSGQAGALGTDAADGKTGKAIGAQSADKAVTDQETQAKARAAEQKQQPRPAKPK